MINDGKMEKNKSILIFALIFMVINMQTNIKHECNDSKTEKNEIIAILALVFVEINIRHKYDVHGDKYNQGVCIANIVSVIHGSS